MQPESQSYNFSWWKVKQIATEVPHHRQGIIFFHDINLKDTVDLFSITEYFELKSSYHTDIYPTAYTYTLQSLITLIKKVNVALTEDGVCLRRK